MSNDPEQEFFADGLVDDILTTLSKLSGLNVIARNSSFAYKGKNVDVRQAGGSSARATCSKGACGRPATASASPRS